MPACFSPNAMKFLRGLARHNDREWFEARRAVYEQELRVPMLALIEEINAVMAGTERRTGFAPDHVRPPAKVMMRIYRDIRFSSDKRPYKTHISAWWSRRGMEKTSGAGYYVDIGPKAVFAAAGVYMPERAQLLALRRWMAGHHAAYRKLLASAQRARRGSAVTLRGIDGQPLSRMPKGFAADHPAGDLLRARNWGVHADFPVELALSPQLGPAAVEAFRRSAPLVDALNGAILAAGSGNTAEDAAHSPRQDGGSVPRRPAQNAMAAFALR